MFNIKKQKYHHFTVWYKKNSSLIMTDKRHKYYHERRTARLVHPCRQVHVHWLDWSYELLAWGQVGGIQKDTYQCFYQWRREAKSAVSQTLECVTALLRTLKTDLANQMSFLSDSDVAPKANIGQSRLVLMILHIMIVNWPFCIFQSVSKHQTCFTSSEDKF